MAWLAPRVQPARKPPLGYRSGLQHARGGARVNRRVVARYFPGRSELIVILREFTQDLFGGAAEAAGKRTWCEKTPFNLLSVRFLLELFPEATVVVIMRHPVEVAASHLDQPWAPSTLDGVLGWLEPVYQRWLAQRPALLKDRRYVEVKAGNLAARWPTCRRELFSRLGLPDADTASTFAPTRLVSRRAQLSDNQQAEAVSRLGWAAGELGYPARPRTVTAGLRAPRPNSPARCHRPCPAHATHTNPPLRVTTED
jgi:omega-hydroxy-beta-dihydromenaquinone-9 sulfotransferase